MANDFFGNLGSKLEGLVNGVTRSGPAPQDDPAVLLVKAQSDISDLKTQENIVLAEIGRQAFDSNPSQWPQAEKLQSIRADLASAQQRLDELMAEQEADRLRREAEEHAREEMESAFRCASCGHVNPDGVNFCQECGTKMNAARCVSCGAQLPPGTKFCGECGAKQSED